MLQRIFYVLVLSLAATACKSPQTTASDASDRPQLAQAAAIDGELTPVKNRRGLYGFIDRSGAERIPPQFADAMPFSEGLAAVNAGGRWGFIDASGQLQIPAQFILAQAFSEGLALVTDGQGARYIDPKGKTVLESSEGIIFAGSFSNGLAPAKNRSDDKFGAIDRSGNFVVEPTYDVVGFFDFGYATVRVGNGPGARFGLLRNDGMLLVPPENAWVAPILEGRAFVGASRTQANLIDGDGQLIKADIPGVGVCGTSRPTFASGLAPAQGVPPREPGASRLSTLPKCGYLDRDGNVAIPFKFEDARLFSEGLAAVRVDRRWGFINPAGEFIIEPQFLDVFDDFKNGLAPVKTELGQEGFVNSDGILVWEK